MTDSVNQSPPALRDRMILLGNIIFYTIVAYVLLLAGLYLMQRKLIYVPSHTPAYSQERALPANDERFLLTPDGIRLRSWWFGHEEEVPTILYFHGNAGRLEDRTDKYTTLFSHGFNVLAISWRGYGGNSGKPTEEGLYTDARTAIRTLHQKGIPDSQIIFYGESLGSGVAVQMATESQPMAVILEAPYTSVANRAAEMYPFIPVKKLIQDQYDSLGKIKNVTAPLLILHGEADKVIPVSHGKALFAAANEPKQIITFPETGHVDFNAELLAANVEQFIKGISTNSLWQ